MKLKTQLGIAFLACGILPLLVAGTICYSSARRGMSTLEGDAALALNASAEEQLTAIRELKKRQVNLYFEGIRKLILDLSDRPIVISGMKELSAAFHDVKAESTTTDLTKARTELLQYYSTAFAEEYRRRNGGQSPSIAEYIASLSDNGVLLQLAYVKNNPNPGGSKQKWSLADGPLKYDAIHANVHAALLSYIDRHGMYDTFLIDSESEEIVYTTFKEVDFGCRLSSPLLASSALAEVFHRVNNQNAKDFVAIADVKTYSPSYEATAFFVGCPIYDGDKKLGVAVFQLSDKPIAAVMVDRAGLGRTGETILVGPDYLPRSDSYTDPENRSVAAAIKAPSKGQIDNEFIRKCFEKGEDVVAVGPDYAGNEAIAAYGLLDVMGLKWVLVAKMDTAEALASVDAMRIASGQEQFWLVVWVVGGSPVINHDLHFRGLVCQPHRQSDSKDRRLRSTDRRGESVAVLHGEGESRDRRSRRRHERDANESGGNCGPVDHQCRDAVALVLPPLFVGDATGGRC